MPGIDGKPLTFVKIRLPNALLGFVASFHWSEVPFFQFLVGLRSERFCLVATRPSFSHQCNFLARHFTGTSLLSLNMVFSYPRDWWKTSDFCQNSPDLGFGASLHWSEVPLLQSLAWFRSERFVSSQPVLVSVTRAISWLDISSGHPRFPLIYYS